MPFWTSEGREGERVAISNPGQPPVAALARILSPGDLPSIAPGTMLGLQIDAPGTAAPVALTGLEVGENLRIGTRQAFSAAGAQTLTLDPQTNWIDKESGANVTLNGLIGGQPGRIVLLQHTSPGTTTTLGEDAAGVNGFLNPGASSFIYGPADGIAGFAYYDGQVSRWRVFPRGLTRSEQIAFVGPNYSFNTQGFTVSALSVALTASLSTFAASAAGAASLTSTGSQVVVSASSNFIVNTAGSERFEIRGNGSWQVENNPGTAGQALISTGASTPPGWNLVGPTSLNGGVLASLLGTVPTATNAITDLSVGAVTVPANSVAVGTTYIANLSVEFVHTASATPTLTLEWVHGGTVVCTRVITVTAVAGTYTLWVEGYFRHTTIGAASSARVSIRAICTAGAAVNDQIGETTAVPAALNTTISRTLEMRCRMTTAVAANTITLHQATIARIINL